MSILYEPLISEPSPPSPPPQEMKEMNIPVVHNLSDYGLKWENIDNIIEYINIYM